MLNVLHFQSPFNGRKGIETTEGGAGQENDLSGGAEAKERGGRMVYIYFMIFAAGIYYCCCSLFFDLEVGIFIPRVCGIRRDTVYLFLFTDETDADAVVFPF